MILSIGKVFRNSIISFSERTPNKVRKLSKMNNYNDYQCSQITIIIRGIPRQISAGIKDLSILDNIHILTKLQVFLFLYHITLFQNRVLKLHDYDLFYCYNLWKTFRNLHNSFQERALNSQSVLPVFYQSLIFL